MPELKNDFSDMNLNYFVERGKITMVIRFAIYICMFLMMVTSIKAQDLKVMSYNIHHGRNTSGEVDLKRIAEVIKDSGAEMIGLQEVDSVCGRSGKVDQMKVLAKLTGMHYTFKRHFAYDGGAYGLGILSIFPISNVNGYRISSYTEPEEDEKTLVFLTADLKVNPEKIIHFATVHFDYRKDPAVRSKQASEVTAYLKKVTHPVILTGDLNAESDKKEIKYLYRDFEDTDSAGAFTFPSEHPVKKIDYILVSHAELKEVIHHDVIDEALASDHRPVAATIILK